MVGMVVVRLKVLFRRAFKFVVFFVKRRDSNRTRLERECCIVHNSRFSRACTRNSKSKVIPLQAYGAQRVLGG
jgi:hypothetical protein